MGNSWLSTLVLLTCVTVWSGVCVDAKAPRCYKCYNSPVCTRQSYEPCPRAQSCNDDESMKCRNKCEVMGIFPVPDEPKKYFICLYNEVTNRLDKQVKKCPPSTTYNMRTMKCLTKAEANKLRYIPPEIQRGPRICRGHGKMPFEDNIKKYYECEFDGVYAKEVYCPENHYFDDKFNNCVQELTPKLAEKMKKHFENVKVNANNLYASVQRRRSTNTKTREQNNYWPRIYFGGVNLTTESSNDAVFSPVNSSSVTPDDYTRPTDKTSTSHHTSPSPSSKKTPVPHHTTKTSSQTEKPSTNIVSSTTPTPNRKEPKPFDMKKYRDFMQNYKKLVKGTLTFPPEVTSNDTESNIPPSTPQTKAGKPTPSPTRIPPLPPLHSC